MRKYSFVASLSVIQFSVVFVVVVMSCSVFVRFNIVGNLVKVRPLVSGVHVCAMTPQIYSICLKVSWDFFRPISNNL